MNATTLEVVEAPVESDLAPLLHSYCPRCVHATHEPELVSARCGGGKGLNAERRSGGKFFNYPPERRCVVCDDLARNLVPCERCGWPSR